MIKASGTGSCRPNKRFVFGRVPQKVEVERQWGMCRASSLLLGVFYCLVLAWLPAGCCGDYFGAEPGDDDIVIQPSPQDPAPAPQPVGGDDPQVVISAGAGGLGGMQISSGGRAVWPPSGPGCDRYVECCNAAVAVDSSLGLACQLFVVTEPVNCNTGLTQVRSQLTELGREVPTPCNAAQK